jgi:hypothetical protein
MQRRDINVVGVLRLALTPSSLGLAQNDTIVGTIVGMKKFGVALFFSAYSDPSILLSGEILLCCEALVCFSFMKVWSSLRPLFFSAYSALRFWLFFGCSPAALCSRALVFLGGPSRPWR